MSLQDEIEKYLGEALGQVKFTGEESQIIDRCQARLVAAVETIAEDPAGAKQHFDAAVATMANLSVAKGIQAEKIAKQTIAKTLAALAKYAFGLALT